MFGLGAGEVLVILVFALIFIGPKKLPELARGLGKSLREFQKAKDELLTQVEDDSEHHQVESVASQTATAVDDAPPIEEKSDKSNEGPTA